MKRFVGRGNVGRVKMLCVCMMMLIGVVSIGAGASAEPIARHGLMGKLRWRCVGPYIGGRVVAVDGVASQPDLFYMGSVDGGVWKSTNYGISWTNISDGWPSSSDSIGAIAVAPSNPKIIYAGTGESDIRGDMITGDGVFKSTDGGKHWHYAGLKDTHTTMGLVVDPKNPDVVYDASMGHVFKAGPHRGVYKSTDGGKTWHKVLFINNKTGVVDLVMDPRNPNVLYAAAWQAYRKPWKLSSGGPGSGIYKTTDGGRHWVNITKHPGLPSGILGKIGVAVAASNPSVVYATIQAKRGGVFRSDDGGKTWKRVNKNWNLRQRAFYYMAVFVDPKDPDTVYMPQVNALYVSHDGGKSFKELHTPHGDNHIVWINPENPAILLEGNDGGATVSTDAGKTWSTEHNQPTGQFYHVNLDSQFPFHIYGAQQDEGSFEGPSASSDGEIPLRAWHTVAYGESTVVAPQPDNPKITYGSGYFSLFIRNDRATGENQSVSPWPSYRDGASSGKLRNRFGWSHPILFSPANPDVLYTSSQYVWRSADFGRNWTRISPDLTRDVKATEAPTGGPIDLDQSGAEIYPFVSALAVSPVNGEVIWAGSSDGLVHVSTDGGKHWREVRPSGLPKWSRVSSIQASNVSAGTAYLTARRYMWDDFKPYVYKTTDYGRHWSRITQGLPDNQYVLDIKQDPKSPKLLFLGTKNTVYISFDGGGKWQPLKLNLPHVQVRGIAINRRQGDVVIATHGRSFWVLDNLSLLEQMVRKPRVTRDEAALFAPETAWLTHAYGKAAHRSPTSTSGENPPFGATVFFHIPANYHGHRPVKLEFANADGTVIRSFALHLKMHNTHKSKPQLSKLSAEQRINLHEKKLTAIQPGMNRFQWDLRYPYATEVKGFYAPAAAGGLANSVRGPQVTPGSYHVILDYGGHKIGKAFEIKLDPRLRVSQQDLKDRRTLQLKIHDALDRLDTMLNQAISLRAKLHAAVQAHHLATRQARTVLAELGRRINSLVQLKIASSEGDLLHPTKMRSHLAYLSADIGLGYVKPTPAQYAVFRMYDRRAKRQEGKLKAAIRKARKLL